MGPLGEATAGASDYVFTWEREGERARERKRFFLGKKKVCLVNLLLQRGYYAFTL